MTGLTPQEQFYLALGRFIYEWGQLELVLDLLMLLTETDRDAKRPLSHQLEAKIERIRCYVRGSDREAEISVLMDDIFAHAETRHDFVHGAVVHHRVEDSGLKVTLGRLAQPNRRQRRKPVEVTPGEITAAAERVSQLVDRVDKLLEHAKTD